MRCSRARARCLRDRPKANEDYGFDAPLFILLFQEGADIHQVKLGKLTAPGDQVLFLLAHSSERLVHDRIRNYLQKYLPSAQEVTERDVVATGAKPGTPKFQKTREELILTKLDARPKKVPPPVEQPGPQPAPAFARKG